MSCFYWKIPFLNSLGHIIYAHSSYWAYMLEIFIEYMKYLNDWMMIYNWDITLDIYAWMWKVGISLRWPITLNLILVIINRLIINNSNNQLGLLHNQLTQYSARLVHHTCPIKFDDSNTCQQIFWIVRRYREDAINVKVMSLHLILVKRWDKDGWSSQSNCNYFFVT